MQFHSKPLPDFDALDFVPKLHYFAIKYKTFHKHFGKVSLPDFFFFLTAPLTDTPIPKFALFEKTKHEPFWSLTANSQLELLSNQGNEVIPLQEYKKFLNDQINRSFHTITPYHYSLNDIELITKFERQWDLLFETGHFERS